MSSLLNLLQTKGSVYTNLDGTAPTDQYAQDMTDNLSLHQVGKADLNKSVLDLDAKTPDRYKNPEKGTTYP